MSAGSQPSAEFAVVGIGASAGGLEAFRSLFGALPRRYGHGVHRRPAPLAGAPEPPREDAHVASPPCRSSRCEDGMPIAPGRVYVMPSNAEVLALDAGASGSSPPAPPGGAASDRRAVPIARRGAAHPRAIGVVLSGTGADGTERLKEIKAEGGITFAQDAATAQFSGMPASASAAGVVDRVLPPGTIALELARLSSHPYMAERDGGDDQPFLQDRDQAIRILSLVRRVSGVDYSMYRPSTVGRRIARRMALHRIGSMGEYGAFVEKEPEEAQGPLGGPAHPRHRLLPGPDGLRGARADGLSTAPRRKRAARPHLGAGMLLGRGGLLAGHVPPRAAGRPVPAARLPDLRLPT